MVSGKPPRRSKSTSEPVTIDLDAKDVTKLDDPENGTVQPQTGTQQQPHEPAETPAAEDRPEPADADDTVAASSETVDVIKNAEPAADQPAEQEPSPAPETPEKEPEPKYAASAAGPNGGNSNRPVSGPSGTSLAIAGIIGGLIALAGAGSMQYAGYLPPLSTPATNAVDTSTISSDVEALRQQIGNLETVATRAPDTSAIENRLAALETALQESTAPPPVTESVDLAPLEEKLAALETAIGALRSEVEENARNQGASENELARRLEEAERRLDEPRQDVEVARTIALAALKGAVDRGDPFLTELNTFAGVAPDDPRLEGLRTYATTGIASRAELSRRVPAAATAILAAIHQPDPDQGIAERLLSSARALVKVRPVGNVEGETPEAIVARMEDKLRNGDLKGALLEWESLPDAGKTASSDFKTALEARVHAEELVEAAITNAASDTDRQG